MLKSRLITALLLIPLVIVILFYVPPYVFFLLLFCLYSLAAWEWSALAGYASTLSRINIVIFYAFLIFIFYLPSINSFFLNKNTLLLSVVWWIFAFLLVVFYRGSKVKVWWRCKIVRLLFGIVTLLPFFTSSMLIRETSSGWSNHSGIWWLFYVLCLVWAADSGAYFFGKKWGKHKLIPQVSPGKTWEGLFGGVLTACLIAILFAWLTPIRADFTILLFCSLCAILASILGDLTESMLKREAGLKDSGNLLPGHGGILDRIDSLTAAIPVFTWLLLTFNVV